MPPAHAGRSVLVVCISALALALSSPSAAQVPMPSAPARPPALAVEPVPPPVQACAGIDPAISQLSAMGAINTANVRQFYDLHGGDCAWTTETASGLIEILRASGDEGLEPALFQAETLYWPVTPLSSAKQAARDVLFTDAALKYAVIVSRGLSWDASLDLDQAADYRPNRELVDGLIDALYSGDTAEWLRSLPPQYEVYQKLRMALIAYRALAEGGGWEQIPDSLAGPRRKAKSYDRLRRRLAMEGDLSMDSGSSRFDDSLKEALIRFQTRNGLRADGVLTAKTVGRLNVSASERVAMIALNLERLRVSLRDLPQTRVEVNVPAATMILFREGVPHLTMNVVVGAPKHETPELASRIDTIVLNPTWTIPQSIIQNEIKPLLKRNPKYLRQNSMYWSGDQLVQEPGPQNALGRIKFDFPNRYSVYLHDTPSRRLFTDPERAASHGCVRLERPLDLAAELLLGDGDWDRNALADAIASGATKRIGLREKMPVVISYQTAFVDEHGLVNFRPDVYGRDTALTLRLSEKAASLKSEPVQW